MKQKQYSIGNIFTPVQVYLRLRYIWIGNFLDDVTDVMYRTVHIVQVFFYAHDLTQVMLIVT
jgi:hypothetical protein